MDEGLMRDKILIYPVFQIYYYYINFQILLSWVENHNCIGNIWEKKRKKIGTYSSDIYVIYILIKSKRKRKEMDDPVFQIYYYYYYINFQI